MWKNLFDEWLVAYRAKGGRVSEHEEELCADFFGWLKAKAAEQSVHSDAGDSASFPNLFYPIFNLLNQVRRDPPQRR